MNGAHYHLLVNHVPLFGVVFGLMLFIWSRVRNSQDVLLTAVALFVIAAIFGWIANETGEMAEDIAEKMPTVTKALIHEHEEAAEVANIMCSVLAVAALGLLGAARFKSGLFKPLQVGVAILAFICSLSMARTAYLGGHITHTEIRSGD